MNQTTGARGDATRVAAAVAFAFWFFWANKPLAIIIFFKSNPAMGTAAISVTSAVFVYITLVIYSFIKSSNRRLNKSDLPIGAIFFLIFLSWSGISILWGELESKRTAFLYWCSLLADISVPLILCRLGAVNTIAIQSMKGCVVGGVVFALITLTLVSSEGGRLGDTELLHPNVIGRHASLYGILAIFLMTQFQQNLTVKLFWQLATLLSLFLLVSSFSKTSIFAFGSAIIIYLSFSKIKIWQKAFSTILILSIVFVFYAEVAEQIYDYRYFVSDGKALATLSGRTILWSLSWERIQDNLIFGHGMLSFRSSGPYLGEFRPVNAHNEFIQVWYSLGLVGVVLGLLTYLSLLVQIIRSRNCSFSVPQRSVAMALLIYALVRGLTEADVLALVFPSALLSLIFVWLPGRDDIPKPIRTKITIKARIPQPDRNLTDVVH